MRLTAADHAAVLKAVAAAEATTSGEIVAVVAGQSDDYRDVGLHWTALAMLLVPALLAVFPAIVTGLHARLVDPWASELHPGETLWIALVIEALVWALLRLLLASPRVRIALAPKALKARRVRRQAMTLFRVGAEKRTAGATGVLLYLSLDEHRAEIVADGAITSKVSPDVWGAAMAALIEAVRNGQPGAGIAAAVERIGAILAPHFPRAADDVNELPDRLIEL